MGDFSLEIPHLTYYLGRILKRYPLGGQILKELLQNAEDSNASVVKFFIDYTHYPKDNLLHEDLAKFQGPALLAYNDSQFEESDFKSIRNIEKSEKYDKPLKIGKFGLGFNSIYHLTDLPTIVSGNDIIIFDPHEKYFLNHDCKRGIRFNFKNEKHHEEFFSKFPNQFMPYLKKSTDDTDEIDFKNEYKGTLFRFPIRIEPSELSDQVKPIDKIIYEDILDSFFKDFNLILLFLRRIERIEIYEISDQNKKLIATTFIDYESSSLGLKQQREEFFNKLVMSTSTNDKTMNESAFNSDDISNNFKLVIKTKILTKETMNEKNDKYLVSNYVRFKSSSAELKDLALKTATFPTCGVAYKINDNDQNTNELSEKFKQMRYFCFLPMPETIERTGLPLHINGSFGLRDDRRDFKWLANDTKEDESAKWNELMVKETLTQVLHNLLNYAKNLIENNDKDISITEFYYLLPNLDTLSLNWKEKHLREFINSLIKMDVIFTQNKKWMNIKDVYLTNKIENELKAYSSNNNLNIDALKKTIYECFDSVDLALSIIPNHVIQINQELCDNLKYINTNMLCKALSNKTEFNSQQKADLLNYLIQNLDDLNILTELSLVPLLNSKWVDFTKQKVYFFKNKTEIDLFASKFNAYVFDELKLNTISKKKLIHWLEEHNIANLSLYDSNNLNDFIYLLTKSLESKDITIEWLNDIWNYIRKYFNESKLNLIEHLNLLPKINNNQINLFPLKPAENMIYFHISQSSDDIPKEFIEFIEPHLSNIIIFNNLPNGFSDSLKRKDYVIDLDLNSFPRLFKCIFKSLGNKLTTLLNDQMATICKNQLSELLDSMKKTTFSNDVAFKEIIKDYLPIFKSQNNGTFKTAKDCNYYKMPSILLSQSHLIDPNIDLIDSSHLDRLTFNLDFTDYPLDRLIIQSIDYNLENKNESNLNDLFKFSLINSTQNATLNNMTFQRDLFSKEMFKSGLKWIKINHFYDPYDSYVKIFIPINLHLPADISIEPFYTKIKDRLLKNIDLKYFIEFIAQIKDKEQTKTVFNFVNNDKANRQDFLKSSLNHEWLPSISDNKLHKGSDLWSTKLKDLVGYIEPIVDNNIVPIEYNDTLLVKNKLNVDVVFNNYSHIVQNNIQIESEIIKQIYDYFQMNSDNLVKKFNEKFNEPFIYTFDSVEPDFRASNELVLDYPDHCSLSPFLYSLQKNKNKFISKLESLYVDVFKILPKVTLSKLIEILEKIKNENKNSNNFIMVRNILETIEKTHLDELSTNDNLKKRLLLPIMINAENEDQFDLELSDKCVYLFEDDNNVFDQNKIEASKDKNLNIIDLRFKNYKFLKKIGIKSFTESVMNIENLFIENYGQTEELTERLKKLLDGYKDGLAIFKEAIQNADDSMANVVKICYDKRRNSQFKNTFKLLDKCMVNAQGPALLFYNDSVFTENDFKALIKLGAGTKRDSKEKIGKFGLGFNSFYNITDVPSIVSSDSLVIFDPNVKYLKNIIQNNSQPGIRLNLSKANKSDISSYYDQFKPYENIFGCKIFEDNFNYNGTLIRLPLRNESSKISSKIYDNQTEITNLLEILFKNIDILLLFTQSVKKIQVYVLEDDCSPNDMKLLFEYENSAVKFIQNHEIIFKNNLLAKNQFTKQTSILRAANENLNTNESIETALIVKSSINIDETNLKGHFEQIPSFKKESYWMLVSSFDQKFMIKNRSDLVNFIPCVGMATELERENGSFKLKTDQLNNGLAFCFLPLSIETNLNYHINANFILSEDRLQLYESSQIDIESYKHIWNQSLIDPLISNLFRMIYFVSKNCSIDNNSNIIEHFWPLNNKVNYFIKFEEKFYNKIIESNENIFPIFDQQQALQLVKFEQSIFVDFEFKRIQDLAIKIASVLLRAENMHLVNLKPEYINKLKRKLLNNNSLMNEYLLLHKVIDYKHSIKASEYEEFISNFIKEKTTENADPQIIKLLKSNNCIPTAANTFELIEYLINPNASEYYMRIFENNSDRFPSKDICNDQHTMLCLKKLGIMNEILKSEIIVFLACNVEALSISGQINAAKKLSLNLLGYLSTLNQNELNKSIPFLINSKWIFPKQKPDDWSLPWYTSSDTYYKPNELINDKYQLFIGCIKPVFDSSVNCNFLITNDFDDMDLINNSLEQLKFLISNSNDFSKDINQICQVEEFLRKFYLYLQDFTTENLDIDQQERESRILTLKSILPSQWIYCRENESEKFLTIDSFALDVSNPFEPELLKIPSIYASSHHGINFFKHFGVPDHFSLESLKDKLKALKEITNEEPLNRKQLELCHKITNEILFVESLNKEVKLIDLCETGDFYLPDSDAILRNINDLCFTLKTDSSKFIKTKQMFLIDPFIVPHYFGIETLEKKLLLKVGKPFGQKEKLVNRIKDILQRYSSTTCIFKELIQNADDSNANEIRFILDYRTLKEEKTFDKKFNPLQKLPALCVWNNSIFKDNDFEGIISIGQGSKEDSIEKTGRFGVGFNSIYHITDSPMFISNNEDFVIFDPLCIHFPGVNELEPGYRITNIEANMTGIYDDVLSGFNFGINFEGELKTELSKATMFRFPIRSGFSNISYTSHNAQQIEDMMTRYVATNKDTLLFLKNIKKMSFYTLKENDGQLNLTCIHKEQHNYEDRKDAQKRDKYFKSLMHEINSELDEIKTNINDYSITIETSNDYSKEVKKNQYLLFEQYGFDKVSNEEKIQNLNLKKKKLNIPKYFPMGGIAFELSLFTNFNISFKNLDFKIYNFLPLEHKSPLNCQINGYWALSKENRTQLYDYAETETTVEKEKALWNTEWNLSIINFIILPCYLRLLAKLKQKVSTSTQTQNMEIFCTNMIQVFPDNLNLDSRNKSYFKEMFKSFYEQKVNQLECIPIVQNYEPNQKKEYPVKWFKPNELIFTENLEKFLNYDVNRTNEICSILLKTGIKIFKSNDFYRLFSRSGIIVSSLTSDLIIKHLKANDSIIDVIPLKETIFKNFKNLADIFTFCQSNDENYFKQLENCPLLVSNDNCLRRFTSKRNLQLFYYEQPEIFTDVQDKFLNRSFFKLLRGRDEFSKIININDLSLLLPTALKKDVYHSKNYPILNDTDKPIIEKIWNIILNDLGIIKIRDLNKMEKIHQLEPISGWALIPVQINTSQTHLAKISDCQNIISDVENGIRFSFLNLIGSPTLKRKVFGVNIEDFLSSITNSLNKNEDLLSTFVKQRDNLFKLSDENLKLVKSFLETSIQIVRKIHHKKNKIEYEYAFKQTHANCLQEQDIKRNIKSLPIFKNFFKKVDVIPNKMCYLITSDVCLDGLESFCNENNCYLLENDLLSPSPQLYEYLGVESLDLKEFYIKFLTWASTLAKVDFFKKHLVYITKNLTLTPDITAIISQIRFVYINGSYKLVNECYDHEKELFHLCFKDSFLPQDFTSETNWPIWKDLMVNLGLQRDISIDECILFAGVLRDSFNKHKFDMKMMDIYVQLLFVEIKRFIDENKGKQILENIKSIRFIPNYFNYTKESVLTKIFNPNSYNDRLICLKGSYFKANKDFIWITHKILPNYCETFLKCQDKKKNANKNQYFELAEINYQLDPNHLVDNFIQMIEIIKKSDLLRTLAIDKLDDLTFRNLDAFEGLLDFNKNNIQIFNKMNKLDIIINPNSKNQFIPVNKCVKMLKKYDVVEPFIYSLPRLYLQFSSFLKNFGLKEKVTYKMCSDALKHLFEKSKQHKLTKIQYRNAMTVYKLLFDQDILSKKTIKQETQNSTQKKSEKFNLLTDEADSKSALSIDDHKLYAPNKSMEMKELNTLFYVDVPYYDVLIEHNEELKDVCLFDVKDLSKLFENPHYYDNLLANGKLEDEENDNNETSDSHLLKKITLKRLNWTQLFESFPFFKAYPNLAPAPISKILKQIINDDNSTADLTADNIQNEIIHSNEFADAIIDVIQLFDLTKKNTINIEVETMIKDVLKNIKCSIQDKIKSYFINVDTNETIENSQRDLNFANYKDDETDEIIFLRSKSYVDEFEKNFYLAVTIFESIQSSLKETIDTNIQSINDLLKNQSHQFIFLIIRLLQNKADDYKLIIDNYSLNSMFMFK